MAEPVRVGLIGTGFAGRTFHAPLVASVAGLQLVAATARRAEQAAEVARRWPAARVEAEAARLIEAADVELVVVATPNDSHHALARAALLAGKHVVIDKPFAVTVAECDDLIAVAKAQGRVLSVFHNRRWDGDFLSLQRVMASGALGEVRNLISRLHRFAPAPRQRWREVPGPGSGLWIDFGPHLIDQALQLFGAPATVTADLAMLRDGATTDDYAQVVLGYPQRRVTLSCTRLAAHAAARFEAHGTRGSFHCEGWDVQETQLKDGMAPGDDHHRQRRRARGGGAAARAWGLPALLCWGARCHHDRRGSAGARCRCPPGDGGARARHRERGAGANASVFRRRRLSCG
jgi:predicted dehydrogenase